MDWDTDLVDSNNRRMIGSRLTPNEILLLERLSSGDWAGSRQAPQQAAYDSWGGLQFEDCEDFLIDIPEHLNLDKIPSLPGGPFSILEVFEEKLFLGHLELWVLDGVLHSVDYITFGAPDRILPEVHQLASSPFASWLDSDDVSV
ncbi:hypothetical protein [Glutamicibacter sp. NPDC087344]|uniref:hypothetical protein n=1 Tax=Glutamicibacter sp. NPDC087344 TaxID=3363994 RepID=UPI0038175CE7